MGYLNKLGDVINGINHANGWNVPAPEDWGKANRIPALLALIHSEVSEALEAFRNHDPENFAEELADIQIRLLDTSRGLGVDLDREVEMKLEKNRNRGYRHGGKKV